jgi:hypothetical protein
MNGTRNSLIAMCLSVAVLGMVLIGTVVIGMAVAPVYAQAPDPASKAPTWRLPEVEDVKAQAFAWLEEHKPESEAGSDSARQQAIREKAAAVWSSVPAQAGSAEMLDALAETLALADERVAGLVRLCSRPKGQLVLPGQPWLRDPQTPPLVANNMRLLYGRWLVHQEMFDESLEQLAGLKPADVVAPDLLLFYQGVAQHALLDKQAGLKTLGQLLQRGQRTPRRYVVLGELMQQDLETLEDDSLDHIARRMDDVRRRLELARAGPKVRQVEDGVVESLDKLIKKLEEQRKKCQGGGGGNLQPSSPAPDSQILTGRGRGEVIKRAIGSGSGWGNLPPKEREEALQQIGRDFPPHYREVIEQYFRRLAAEGSD